MFSKCPSWRALDTGQIYGIFLFRCIFRADFFEDGGLGRKNGRMDEKKRGICLEVREIVRIFAAVK